MLQGIMINIHLNLHKTGKINKTIKTVHNKINSLLTSYINITFIQTEK